MFGVYHSVMASSESRRRGRLRLALSPSAVVDTAPTALRDVREEELASALIAVSDEGQAFVAFVMTRSSAQRSGLATMLLDFAVAKLDERGDISLDLYVTTGASGEALYERLRYREV